VTKQCCDCKEIKSASSFYRNKRKKDGLASQCKICHTRGNKATREKKPEHYKAYQRNKHFLRKYGLSVSEWEKMYREQGGLCLLCGGIPTDKDRLVVDHCHETGQIRGLLHHSCNVGIGFLKESVEIMEKAIMYINSFCPSCKTRRFVSGPLGGKLYCQKCETTWGRDTVESLPTSWGI